LVSWSEFQGSFKFINSGSVQEYSSRRRPTYKKDPCQSYCTS
jgi:hypothetical protein